MVALIQPQPGEQIQDPAAETGGFLIAADRYIKQHTDDLFDLNEAGQTFQRSQAFYGIELVQDAHRLLLLNMMLHGIEGGVTPGRYPGTGWETVSKSRCDADQSILWHQEGGWLAVAG